jgi:hypothetical protein
LKRALVWVWAALLCAVLFAQTHVRASRPDGIDFTSYLLSARALLHGNSPYLLATPFPYLYPATLAFLLIPLTFVPPVVALALWFALSAVAGTWSIRRVLLAARPELEQRPDDVALFLAIFFTFFFTIVQSNLRNGQVNFLVLALCAAAGIAAAPAATLSVVAGQLFSTGAGAPPPARANADPSPRIRSSSARGGRRRFYFLTGFGVPRYFSAVSWALAVSIKIVPLALLPFFALRRHWTWLVASVLMIGVFCLLPVVVLGTRVLDLYEQYWRVFLASSFAPRAQPLDFSLGGTVAFITGAPLTPLLRLSAAAIVLGWIVPVDGRRLHVEVLRPFGLYLLAIPLVSPQSEVHHLAFMLPAAAIVAARWGSHRTMIAAGMAGALYLTATAVTRLNGPLYCAALIALGVALMNVSPPDVVTPKPRSGAGGSRTIPP